MTKNVTDSHALKLISVSTQLSKLITDTLYPLDITIESWPAEFRIIVWKSIAEVAAKRLEEARRAK
jgi:hypothetical protein